MGSNESHFNVSLIVREKVTKQYPQTTTFEEKGEPKQIRTEPNALPLGQTGSQTCCASVRALSHGKLFIVTAKATLTSRP